MQRSFRAASSGSAWGKAIARWRISIAFYPDQGHAGAEAWPNKKSMLLDLYRRACSK
ncbi:MAG: hypothetical protein IPK96_04900 [Flammeovirgaceae bacterium]|nr:hypothetical protein [Flammeovirgaceae bacterium]